MKKHTSDKMKEEGREDKQPWSKFYWQDFDSDTDLKLCSLAAQGLWMRMLSIMAKSKKKGFLLENEKQMKSKNLAKLIGASVEEIELFITELEQYGVFSRDSQGVIYNRRMRREAELSKKRAEAGAMGGRPKKKIEKQNESKSKACSASAYASASEYAFNNKEYNKVDEEFEEFWKFYRSIGNPEDDVGDKQEARKAYRILRKSVSKEEIARAVHGEADYLKHKRLEDNFEQRKKFASTWLRSGRWGLHKDFKYKSPL